MALRLVPFVAVGTLGVVLGVGASVGLSRALTSREQQSIFFEATFPDAGGFDQVQRAALGRRASVASAQADMTSAEAAERVQDEHRKKIQAFDAEAIDSVWAASTEKSIRTGLTELAKRVKFESKTVACKTTSCVAVLRWPSYEIARTTYTDFLHSSFASECGRAILLPPVDKQAPGAAVEATLVLKCNRDRSGGAEGVEDAP